MKTVFTVYLVDDDPSAREGLSRLLRVAGHTVVVFTSAREFLEAGPPSGPCCLVLDIRMPELNGLELEERLARSNRSMPIIFVTGHGDIPMSVRAMKRGAVDFLPKPVDRAQLLAAIQQAQAQDASTRQQRTDQERIAQRYAQLTEREREVLHGVVRGQLNKQIASELGIAEPTVKIHRGRVMEKMGVDSVAELVVLIQRARIGAEETRPSA